MVLAFLIVVVLVQRLLCKAAQRMHDSGRQYSVVHSMRHEKGLAKELLTGQEDSRFHSAEDGNKNTPLMGSIYFNSTKNHKTQNKIYISIAFLHQTR